MILIIFTPFSVAFTATFLSFTISLIFLLQSLAPAMTILESSFAILMDDAGLD